MCYFPPCRWLFFSVLVTTRMFLRLAGSMAITANIQYQTCDQNPRWRTQIRWQTTRLHNSTLEGDTNMILTSLSMVSVSASSIMIKGKWPTTSRDWNLRWQTQTCRQYTTLYITPRRKVLETPFWCCFRCFRGHRDQLPSNQSRLFMWPKSKMADRYLSAHS